MFRRSKPAGVVRMGEHDRALRAQQPTKTAALTHGAGRSQTAARAADAPGPREPFTYVHRGTVVTGEITASGRVRVHGEVRGNVTVDGVLEVAESGVVIGDAVVAHEVKVLGRVTADAVTARKVEIWKGGVLTGTVRAPTLDIEEGATFNGYSQMSDVPAGVDAGADGEDGGKAAGERMLAGGTGSGADGDGADAAVAAGADRAPVSDRPE